MKQLGEMTERELLVQVSTSLQNLEKVVQDVKDQNAKQCANIEAEISALGKRVGAIELQEAAWKGRDGVLIGAATALAAIVAAIVGVAVQLVAKLT